MAKKQLTQATYDDTNVQQLPDQVKGQASLVKQTFDKGTADQKLYNNTTLLEELANEDLSNSGSNTIGHNSPNILADNSGDALEELAEKILQVISDGIAPGIPGYYLRTTEDGLSVEWAEVDDTKWVRPVTDNQIAIDELAVKADIDFIVGKDGETYYDYASSGKKRTSGTVDMGFVYAATINQGTNTIEISSLIKAKDGSTPSVLSDCFTVGEEITLANDTQRELFKITNIDDGTATLTLNDNITLIYATGANVYRSNLTANGDVWEFGGFSSQETIDKTTSVQVVNQAYSTQGNGGRKEVVLDNGWVVTVSNVTDYYYFHVDKQDGGGFNQLCFVQAGAINDNDMALVSEGNNVHLAFIYSTPAIQVRSVSFDATTVLNENIGVGQLVTTVSETLIEQGLGLAINEFGGKNKITVSYSAKRPSHPNSFNIFACQGTISNGVVTWGSVEQWSTFNTSGTDLVTPVVVYDHNDNVFVTIKYDASGANEQLVIFSPSLTGNSLPNTSVPNVQVYFGGTYTQSNSSSTFMPPNVATKKDWGTTQRNTDASTNGAIINVHSGLDSTDTTQYNLRIRVSVDGGLNYFDYGVSAEKITTGNTIQGYYVPTLTWNNDADLFVVCRKSVSAQPNQIVMFTHTTSWSSEEALTTQTTASANNPNSVNNFHDFSKPLTIWEDAEDSDVKFYGKWTVGSLTPVTEIDVRVNIEAREDKKQITAFLETNDFDTVTLDGFLSIRQSGNEEAYLETTDTKVDEGTNNMYMSVGSVATGAKLATMKYNLTRANTSDNVQIKRVQGGIAA